MGKSGQIALGVHSGREDASSVHLGAMAVLKSLLRALLMAAAETGIRLMALSNMQSKPGMTGEPNCRSGNRSALLGAIMRLTESSFMPGNLGSLAQATFSNSSVCWSGRE